MKKSLGLIICLSLSFLFVSCSNDGRSASDVGSFQSAKELKSLYLESGDSEYVIRLIDRLRTSSPAEVLASLNALSVIGGRISKEFGPRIIEELRPHLLSDDPAITHGAAATAVAFGEFAYPVLGELGLIVNRNRTGAAFFAAEAIGKIGIQANEAQDVLVDVLGPGTETRIYAIEALSRIGSVSEGNLDRIGSFLANSDDDPYFLIGAAKVLLLNGEQGDGVRRVLYSNVKHPSERRRFKVLHAIEDVGLVNIKWAVPMVQEVADLDPSMNVRVYAREMLEVPALQRD